MQDSQSSLVGQRENRIEKVKKLLSMGINPYPAQSRKEYSNKEILDNYEKYQGKKVTLAGRLMSWREHGHIIFGNIQDDTAKIQLYIKDEVMPKETKGTVLGWNDFHLIDLGDILQVKGEITKTNTGETSILVDGIEILTKALRPLPEKWHGIQDKDERFRRRYLDMTMNPEIRERFKRRSMFWKAVRDFMDSQNFYEVNIPVLEHVTGGADARPFVTHFDALDTDFFLRISHELPLKRLLGAGFEKVYDLGPRFRNEGFSEEHLPEHIAMEFYWAYADINMGMKLIREMFIFIAKQVYKTTKFNIKDFELDLDTEWDVLDYTTLLKNKFNVDIFNDDVAQMNLILKNNGVDLGEETNRSRVVDNLWKLIRKDMAGPAFVINIPKFLSPLSKTSKNNELLTDRVFPIIAGSELANAFGELNDPQDQLNRFVEQQKLREGGDEEAQMMDIDFVEMLEYGMPPAFGFGMSERVFWYFEDVTAREGVPFPPMKWELDNTTKKVYQNILEYIDPHKKFEKKEQDLTKKFVIVVDEKLGSWQLTNTIGHISAYLGSKREKDLVSTPEFDIADGSIRANSQYPVVVLTASQSQLHGLYEKIKEKGLDNLCYVQEMIDLGDDVKLAKALKSRKMEELTICGIGIFGKREELDTLTKKYSLYK